ncbi:hypothetical protein [Microbacterium sp. YY-01]|uniref:hypothetical protein n=1 Tax=Microbacterium sp. YY-01 TaxID=3421634 RepID=UPI003D168E92
MSTFAADAPPGVEIPEIKFGCGFGDMACYGVESAARFLVQAIVEMGNFAGDTIVNAFDQTISDAQWGVAFTEWGKWAAATSIFVLIVMLYQIALGAIMANKERIFQAALGAALGIPLASFAVAFMARLTTAVDEASMIVIRSTADGGIGKAFISVLGLSENPGKAFGDNTWAAGAMNQAILAKSAGGLLLLLFVVVLVLLASFVLMCGMIVRNHGLLILAALAPIALMMIGQGRLTAWAEKWIGLVTGLLLAKPITVGIVSLLLAVLGETTGNTFVEITIAVLFLFVCGLAPFWVVKMFEFAGNEFGGAMASRPQTSRGAGRINQVKNFSRNAVQVFAHPIAATKNAVGNVINTFRR